MGGWAVAQSPILRTTITISRLKKRGYTAMLEVSSAAAFGGHLSFNPSRYEPPYTRPAWFILSASRRVRWYFDFAQQNCERCTPSVYLAEPSTRLAAGFILFLVSS